tara:strand:+ start:3426 stop:3995 length:570 start_codon:yes stop_codon:yes gene_type:complete
MYTTASYQNYPKESASHTYSAKMYAHHYTDSAHSAYNEHPGYMPTHKITTKLGDMMEKYRKYKAKYKERALRKGFSVKGVKCYSCLLNNNCNLCPLRKSIGEEQAKMSTFDFEIPFGTLCASYTEQQQTLQRGHPVGRIGTLHGLTAIVGETQLHTKYGTHGFQGFIPSKKLLRNPTIERIQKYIEKYP